MTLDQLLTSLRERGVQLWREGDQLRYRADAQKLTPELLGQLREQKPAILEFLQKAKVPGRQQPSLHAAPHRGNLPLSFAQQRLWLLDQLEPGSAIYNIPMGLRLAGALDMPVLRRCLSEILRRHESLRTSFEAMEGRPVQVIQPVASLELPLVDLSGLPELERETEAKRLCGQQAQCPFDLRRDLLLRARLFRLGEMEHILFLTMHHIASDAWSMGLLVRELGTLYEAFVEGRPSPLPKLPVQYADFAVWQREWLQGEVLDKQLGYWRKQLEGAPARLELPTDRPRPATRSYRGALMQCDLPKPLSVALGELSRREGATLFMTLLAGFQTLLQRYTSSDEILVGSAIAGRNQREVEPLIGFFVNTLVLRGDLSGNPSFRTLLARTREVALGAYAHQEVPFERLVQELHPERDQSHSPFYQVMFLLQNAPSEAAQLAGLEVTPMPIDSGTSKFDLTLVVRDRDGALQTVIEYNTDLFETETIRRMLGHYQTLLEGIASNPDQRLSDLPLLTTAERHQLVVEWNRTEVDYPRDRCLHELIEEQVERTPEAAAVIFEDQQLTYRQLNERANQLARHLQRLGVGPDRLVGLCVERSLEMVVGLLGILKAGGAYMPLDPEYPKERLAFMLEDACVPVLLTQAPVAARLPGHSSRIVRLDADWPRIAGESLCNVTSSVRAEHLAYMIYTSGSAGRPKGAMNTHVAIVNRLLWMQDTYRLTPSDRVLQKSPFSFDVSVWEFFWPLLTGAGLVVVLPGGHKDAAYLASLIRKEKITTTHFVPSMLSAFLEQGGLESSCASLKRVICSGEALAFELQQRFFSLLSAELHNLYGPTEAAVDVTYWACERESRLRTVPIGRPIANTQIHILDRYLQAVPIGVPGELHIGGIGLARGYHNRPELTAEKFIPDPFRTEAGARLYKTGDLARYLPDGAIEYLGRLDHQVKIRGVRIELGEIESVLAGHPAVREAVVVAREDVPGDKRLVAYLTAKDGLSPKDQELRGLLQAKLPQYMVPSAFVTLGQFPLTPNGKVDRKALPPPEQPRATTGFVPPETPMEVVLAKVWAEVLGLKQVGVHDNFFDLGGHSLLAVRLQTRVEAELGRKLPLAAFFQAPTLAELAKLFGIAEASVPSLHVLAPPFLGGKPPLFWIDSVSAGQLLARHLRPKRLVYGIESSFNEDLRLWDGQQAGVVSVEELAAGCVSTIRRLQPRGPYNLGGLCFTGVLAFEAASQLAGQNEEVTMLALLDSFYFPGREAVANAWARRWAYHARQTSKHGAGYLWTKLRKRLAAEKRRLSSGLPEGRANPPVSRELETEPMAQSRIPFIRRIQEAYKGKPYAGRAVLFRAVGESVSFEVDYGSTNGWKEVLLGELHIEQIECSHWNIVKEPYVERVARTLENYLSKADAGFITEDEPGGGPALRTMQAEGRQAARLTGPGRDCPLVEPGTGTGQTGLVAWPP